MATSPFAGFGNMPAVRDANTWKVFMGITEDNQDEFVSAVQFARAPADEAWVYSCIRRLYTSAQSVPLRVYSKVGRDLVTVEDTQDPDGLELQYLLDNVNPIDMNGSDLKAYTVAGYGAWGGAYWKKVRGKFGGRPRELFYLRVPDVRAEAPDGRTVDHYVYSPKNGQLETIQPKDVLVFKTVNLENPLEPLSPISAARWSVQTGKWGAQHTAALLKNSSVPPGYWSTQKGQEISAGDKGLLQRLFRGLKGPKNAGKVPFIPYDVQFNNLALSPKDAEWISARKLSRMEICAVLGVPLVLAGDDEKTTVYANLRDAEKSFWKGTMIPLLDWYADVINGWLVPDFDQSRVVVGQERPLSLGKLVVQFDYSGIEALQEPYELRVQAASQLADRRALTPNDLRAMFRLGKPYDWGNVPAPSTTRVTLTGMAAPDITDPGAESEVAVPVTRGPGGVVQPDVEWDEPIRSFGRRLYRQDAVRAFVKDGGPLDTVALFGHEVPDDVREHIEDGLRRRLSAAQIADGFTKHEAPAQRAGEDMGNLTKALATVLLEASKEGEAEAARYERMTAEFASAVRSQSERPILVNVAPPNVTVHPTQVSIPKDAVRIDLHMPPPRLVKKTPIHDAEGRITEVLEQEI